jgi:DNA-directed RNA polymerase specialized sigma24 family protein
MSLPIITLDWPNLWRYSTCWAGRPCSGLVLPGSEQLQIAKQVFSEMKNCFPVFPSTFRILDFLRGRSISLALERTQQQRLQQGFSDLWHDPDDDSGLGGIDMDALQAGSHSYACNQAWHTVTSVLRPRAIGLCVGPLISTSDAEDVFMEALTDLAKEQADGRSLIEQLHVYEQIPATLLTIVKRRCTDLLRHQTAQRRDSRLLTFIPEEAVGPSALDKAPTNDWQSAQDDPYHGLTFAQIASECAHCISPLQQRILSALYVMESDSYMDIANAAWFASATGLRPDVSAATKRRTLDREHDGALTALAACLGLQQKK